MACSGAPVIAVVGAGFSGVMVALNLLAESRSAKVLLFEKRAPMGLGAAYSTHNPSHKLNVRAGNMSAWPDRPDHFVTWLRDQGLDLGPGGFATRADYGRYLQAQIAGIAESSEGFGRLVLNPDAVVNLTPHARGWRLTTALGRTYDADVVILALGNPPPARPQGIDPSFVASPTYVADPWRWRASELPQGPVLLIGSGLTMVDVALSLDDAEPGRPMLALSRRGLAPLRHDGLANPYPAPSPELSPLALLTWLKQVAKARGWRTAVDAVRPVTQALWRGWSPKQRRMFLRHARPFWDIHRHRLAPDVGDRIDAMRASGQLVIAAGKIREIGQDAEGHAICKWRTRGGRAGYAYRAIRVINCTGPTSDILNGGDDLICDLVRQGLARPDTLGLGFDLDDDNRLLDAAGQSVKGLFAVGPSTRAAHWEIVAVPDIRGQAVTVARAALASLGV